jgi:predicted acyltransferase
LLFHLVAAGDLSTFRIPGVLQRIGVCVLLAGPLVLTRSWKKIGLAAVVILAGYTALLSAVHAPSFARPASSGGWPVTEIPFDRVPPESRPDFRSMVGSLPSYVDRALFGRHLYRPEYDPEGLLSTLPAVSTVLIGVLAGLWLGTPRPKEDQLRGLLQAGMGLFVAGAFANLLVPINKALWSPSFVLVSGGAAVALLALLGWLLEVRGETSWFRPLEVFGANAFLAYLVSNLLTVVLSNEGPGGTSLGQWILKNGCLSWLEGGAASFLYGGLQVVVWLPLLWVLHRRRLFVKI